MNNRDLEIAIVASGSRGDVQPYIALGKGLQDAGYRVRLLSSANFEELVTQAGLTFCSMGMGVEERLQTEQWRKTLERGNFLLILAQMQKEMKKSGAELAETMPSLLRGSDLIVAGTSAMSAYSIADAFNIPMIQAYVFPFTPTSDFPSPLVPKLPLGQVLNLPSFHITRQMFWQSSKAVDVMTRRVLSLPKASFWGPFRQLDSGDTPVLYGFSPHVLPRPRDWSERYHVTGYWFVDEGVTWQPPADLLDFLNAGDPPVYIGFGSMGGRNPEEAGRIALEALAQSGQRGVLATGWGGLKTADVPKTVHLISSLPHSWLFPRMAAVVHHGGAGTTAAGLRAGVPSIIIPFMGDQAFWGQRTVELGVGVPPIPRKKLTSQRLAGAIHAAVTDSAMRQRADALGRKIRAEDGVGSAVASIERFLR